MDLNTLAPSKEPVFLQLMHPVTGRLLFMQEKDENGNEVDDINEPIGLMMVGSDSDEFAARERWLIDQRIKRAEEVSKGRKGMEFKGETIQEERDNTIIACIKGFRNIYLDEQRLEFSPDNARLLLRRLKWLREYLDREILNRANFIKG